MLDLVWKDIVQGKRTLLMYFLIGSLLGLTMSFAVTDAGSIIAFYMIVSAYGFAIRSTYDEDKSGAYLFLKGLPLSDTAIVASKFVSVLVAAVVLGALFGVIAIIGQGIIAPRIGLGGSAVTAGDLGALLREMLGPAAMLFGIVMVICGVYLAMFFCLGYARASAYNRIVMLGVFAAVMAGSTILRRVQVQPPAWIGALGQSLMAPLLVAAAGLVIYALSCVVSIAWVRVRDWS